MDTIAWSNEEVDFLKRQAGLPRPATPATAKTSTKPIIARHAELMKQHARSERRSDREYHCSLQKLDRGSLEVRTTPWEEQNKLSDQALELANAVGDLVVDVEARVVALRDEMRAALSNVQRHGVGAFPTDEVLLKLFPRSTEVLTVVSQAFQRIMPLFSTSVRHEEPLQLLSQIRRAVQEEIARPVDCPATEFAARWKAETETRLRAADQKKGSLRAALTVVDSSITDKTPLAYELLASPRSVLPTPPVRKPSHIRRVTPNAKSTLTACRETLERHGVQRVTPAAFSRTVTIAPRKIVGRSASQGQSAPEFSQLEDVT